MPEEHELIVLLKKLRLDLDADRAKLSEAIRMAAALDLPDPTEHKCPSCGAGFKGNLSLTEHAYLSHDGPEPEHWKEAERLAAQEAD